MRSRLVGHLSWLAIVALAAACNRPGAPFWRVDLAGHISYLLGTMHRGVPADELPPVVWEALAESRVLYTEADVSQMDPDELAELVTLPPGVLVQAAVSPEDWLLLVHELAVLFDAHELDTLQPWFTHGALIRSYLPPGEEMDTVVRQRAETLGVRLDSFETWQHQAQVLNALGIEDALIPLLRAVQDREQTEALLAEWTRAYQVPDLDALTALALDPDDMAERPHYYEDIILNRNSEWLAVLDSEIESGELFVAVGFAHLLGEAGLVERLRARGATVELAP